MSAQTPPYAIQASSHGAALFRQAHAALFGATQPGTLTMPPALDDSAGFSLAAGGISATTDLAVTQNGTPNMSVNVAGGSCWIPQTNAANGGLYFGLNDATVNLAIAASNPTNPRIDTVVATVNDAAYSGGTNNWVLQVLTGTPTAGATLGNLNGRAAVPASSILIAYVLVPANASTIVTADIQDARPLATLGFPLRGNPVAGGSLGADYVITGTATTFLTTASLAVGKWLVNFTGVSDATGAGAIAGVQLLAGTATASFAGSTSSEAQPTATGVEIPLSLSAIVTVTAAGTLVFQAKGVNATIKSAGLYEAFANATGYTAVFASS